MNVPDVADSLNRIPHDTERLDDRFRAAISFQLRALRLQDCTNVVYHVSRPLGLGLVVLHAVGFISFLESHNWESCLVHEKVSGYRRQVSQSRSTRQHSES